MQPGIVLYDGPSTIDGAPIISIATGLGHPSVNRKTGPMVQVTIIRSDVHPVGAVQSGEDVSICGHCRHRGTTSIGPDGRSRNAGRSCYVTLIHGPSMVWKHLQAGGYARPAPSEARRLLSRRLVRVGAYGDPAAVPVDVWQAMLSGCAGVTGYTHMWRQFPALQTFCMASCDTEVERLEAKALGFRTFRVRARGEQPVVGEAHCPNEQDSNVQCTSCLLCGGNRTNAKADLSIEIHGSGSIHFSKETSP